jgi:hypothetical protein
MRCMGDKRFRIAFSFAGEKRTFVAKVAELLAEQFGREHILYDKYYEAADRSTDHSTNASSTDR